MRRSIFLCSLLALSLFTAAGAANWPNWRGPSFNGAADEKDLPVRFSPTENVRWSVELPGPSAGTPIVWGDHVFVSSTDPKAEQLLAICVDRKTGAVKWKHGVGSGYKPAGAGTPTRLDDRSNYASPSPVTDGKQVVFFYGNGDLVAFDFTGRKLWARNVQKEYGDFNFGWTFSSSPQLYDGRLYVQVLQRDIPVDGRGRDGSESFLLALDPATGRELWKVARATPAKMESREAFTTPIPWEHNGRKELILAGGDLLTGHDPATGKELWRWGTWNNGHTHPTLRLVPSPVAGGGIILACGPKREPVYAVNASAPGQQRPVGLAWKSEERGPVTTDVPTPLFYQGRFYVLSDVRKAISCVEPANGKVVWSTPLEGPTMSWASPTGADGKIYVMNLRGEVHVLDAAKGEILATNPMAEGENELRSSIAVAHGSLFIRTNTRLYCVGK
ncbi:MAG TPA: PQQ-binding-like beta-propeller repeat protein [Armatimonadota bacterium]|nr:PQQ-binding-like beta-propeller repeat protein [Armatimonadota bacterium]